MTQKYRKNWASFDVDLAKDKNKMSRMADF